MISLSSIKNILKWRMILGWLYVICLKKYLSMYSFFIFHFLANIIRREFAKIDNHSFLRKQTDDSVLCALHRTCCWRAEITLTKWNKVGSALFWNSLNIWKQNEHQKKISLLDFRNNNGVHGLSCLDWPDRPCMPAKQ